MSLLPTNFAQASLAAAFLVSLVGTHAALSPPNPNPSRTTPSKDGVQPQPQPQPPSSSADEDAPVPDTMDRLKFTSKAFGAAALVPMDVLALQTAGLAFTYPALPAALLRQALSHDGLRVDLVTWSPATAVPLALLLGAGVPLRLAAYAALGRRFTFALAPPERLTTTGLYAWVQHPSYTGLAIVCLANMALYYRPDGALACWVPARWYPLFCRVAWPALAAGMGGLLAAIWVRVQQEEGMLRDRFGADWEVWHAQTPRFLPWKIPGRPDKGKGRCEQERVNYE